MKRNRIPAVGAVLCSLGLVVLLAFSTVFAQPGPASADSGAPHVTVFVKNYHAEYNLATSDFLERHFDFAESPAYGLVSYTVVTTLTAESLAGSAALVVDESADMSLTAAEATIIHNFVNGGGRVGFFTFPRHYWDHQGADPAAYQAIADLFGITAVGEPAAGELSSGDSSADVNEPEHGSISFTGPYSVTEASVATYDDLPFSPITANGASPILMSPALGSLPVAVANQRGVFVTNPIGDAVQGADANPVYSQFVVDTIVWLATGSGTPAPQPMYLPWVSRQ